MSNENMTNGDTAQVTQDKLAQKQKELAKRPFYAGLPVEALKEKYGTVYTGPELTANFDSHRPGEGLKFVYEDDKGNVLPDQSPNDNVHRAFIACRRKSDKLLGRLEGQNEPRAFFDFKVF